MERFTKFSNVILNAYERDPSIYVIFQFQEIQKKEKYFELNLKNNCNKNEYLSNGHVFRCV